MGKRPMTDDDLFREMVSLYGFRGATALLGWCALFGMAGCQNVRDMRDARIGSVASRYEAVSKLIRLRAALDAAGYELDAPVTTAAHTVGLATI